MQTAKSRIYPVQELATEQEDNVDRQDMTAEETVEKTNFICRIHPRSVSLQNMERLINMY